MIVNYAYLCWVGISFLGGVAVTVKVNGKEEVLEKEISLLQFLQSKNIDLDVVVVEYNYDIVQRDKWGEITLKEGDNLEVLQFVGGG
nr:sulfur carrier protein ThiS [Desulforadius tongensis]